MKFNLVNNGEDYGIIMVNRYLKDNLIMLPRIVGTMTVLFQFVLVYLLIQSIMPYATHLLNLFYHQ